jgi:dipeptidyl aminopeptidase/acylaminoacyl peptidase
VLFASLLSCVFSKEIFGLFDKRVMTYVAAILIVGSFPVCVARCDAPQTKKLFTVADGIGLTRFYDMGRIVQFSPDGRYFAVHGERGRSDLNRPEGTLRLYRSLDIEKLLKDSNGSQEPSPVWEVNRAPNKRGQENTLVVNDWRWLADSSGIAFLELKTGGGERLVLADLVNRTIEPLTPATDAVGTFDIRDRQHYVYTCTAANSARQNKRKSEREAAAVVGTGRSLFELIFPDNPITARLSSPPSYLWAVVGGKRFEVKHDGAPIVPDGNLALSPNGNSIVTEFPASEVPSSWEILYPPPYPSDPLYHLRHLRHFALQYVRIDLQTGSIQSLTEAPVSEVGGSWAGVLGRPSWSSSGREVLLPGTYVRSKDEAPSRPCVAIVDVPSNTSTCIEMLKGKTEASGVEAGYHMILDVHFAGRDQQNIIVDFINRPDWSMGSTEYRSANGLWQITCQRKGEPGAEHNGLEVAVKQSFDEPPLLIATNKEVSRVIWDPNPQLKTIEMGEATLYSWRDKEGRERVGALYKPSNYKPEQRYPLVIQTHAFVTSQFNPDGGFSTAFAARALAASGIVVLQVGEYCPMQTPDEGPCAVSIYESAANQLVSEGVVDRERIGINGFSRTCFYVMETLAFGSLHLKAALVTDGVMADYFQYLLVTGNDDANSIIGGAPFGEGLQLWLKRSPGFNLDKINTPLMVVGEGPLSLLTMWQPYAGLRDLHKPVELVMLNTDEHVLTNPAVLMASQGGSVDWFRFWLQDYEDPAPAKAEQYARWRNLRTLQEANEHNSALPHAASN